MSGTRPYQPLADASITLELLDNKGDPQKALEKRIIKKGPQAKVNPTAAQEQKLTTARAALTRGNRLRNTPVYTVAGCVLLLATGFLIPEALKILQDRADDLSDLKSDTENANAQLAELETQLTLLRANSTSTYNLIRPTQFNWSCEVFVPDNEGGFDPDPEADTAGTSSCVDLINDVTLASGEFDSILACPSNSTQVGRLTIEDTCDPGLFAVFFDNYKNMLEAENTRDQLNQKVKNDDQEASFLESTPGGMRRFFSNGRFDALALAFTAALLGMIAALGNCCSRGKLKDHVSGCDLSDANREAIQAAARDMHESEVFNDMTLPQVMREFALPAHLIMKPEAYWEFVAPENNQLAAVINMDAAHQAATLAVDRSQMKHLEPDYVFASDFRLTQVESKLMALQHIQIAVMMFAKSHIHLNETDIHFWKHYIEMLVLQKELIALQALLTEAKQHKANATCGDLKRQHPDITLRVAAVFNGEPKATEKLPVAAGLRGLRYRITQGENWIQNTSKPQLRALHGRLYPAAAQRADQPAKGSAADPSATPSRSA